MVDVQSHQESTRTAQQTLLAGLLQPLLESRRPQQVLVLQHAAVGDLEMTPLSPAQVIRMSTDMQAENAVLQGRLGALPFGNETFALIVLQHLVGDGREAVLREALRVLAPGGDLLISGLNSTGLRYRCGNRAEQFPGLRLNRVSCFLKSQSFKIERCLRMGLAGMSRPVQKDSGPGNHWAGLVLPFADWVVLHGHHQSHIGNAGILRFRRVQRGRVSSTALDGVSSRKAAS